MRRFRPLIAVAGLLLLVAIWRPIGIRGADPRVDRRHELGKLRLETAQKAFDEGMRGFLLGEETTEVVHRWSLNVLDSHLYLAATEHERTLAFTDHRARMRSLKESTDKNLREHPGWCTTTLDLLAIDYYDQEAQCLVDSPSKGLSRKP